VKYKPEDGTWQVGKGATGLKDARKEFSLAEYQQAKKSLKHFLCHYFSNGDCETSTGSIFPIGGTPKGGKALKVRWGLPGRGKSGGLRLCFAVYCAEKRVILAQAFKRAGDPQDAEFQEAIADL
jgi:hypothetical protein